MITVTRNQAICMFYGEKYTEENVARLSKRLDEADVDICFLDDPAEPFLLWKVKINQNPLRYCTYANEISKPLPENEEHIDRTLLTTTAQAVEFLNNVYLSSDPCNEDMYQYKQVSHKQVLTTIWSYSTLFDDKTIPSFIKWCSHKKVDFLKVASKRRQTNDGERISLRSLYVLKEEYMESTVKRIQGTLAAHQRHIQNLKDEGYTVIGYARKSPASNGNDNRVYLLQKMCQLLKERSSVDHVFISICCKASDPFSQRDKTRNGKILAKLNVDGDIQDMLNCIIGKSKVCIVALDHAGLTTNTTDLSEFLRQNEQVKKIIVDKLPHSNEVIEYDSTQLLHNQAKLEEFDCRRPSHKRSV